MSFAEISINMSTFIENLQYIQNKALKYNL